MTDVNSIRKLAGLKESGYDEEHVVRSMLDSHRSSLERLEKQCKPGGELYENIEIIGGDPSYLKDVIEAASELYSALDEADYGARAHLGNN